MLEWKACWSCAAIKFSASHRVCVSAQHRKFGIVHGLADAGRDAAGLARKTGGNKGKKSEKQYKKDRQKVFGSHVYNFPQLEIKVPKVR
jgi:hypothetical protein